METTENGSSEATQQEKAAWAAKLSIFEEKSMEKYGFYMHLVQDEPGPLSYNLHTHGLPYSNMHKDFQIVLPLPPQVGGSLMHNLVDQLKTGMMFMAGVEYPEILAGDQKVKFIEAVENDRIVLRLILPDKTGELSERKMLPGPFKDQFIALQFKAPEGPAA